MIGIWHIYFHIYIYNIYIYNMYTCIARFLLVMENANIYQYTIKVMHSIVLRIFETINYVNQCSSIQIYIYIYYIWATFMTLKLLHQMKDVCTDNHISYYYGAKNRQCGLSCYRAEYQDLRTYNKRRYCNLMFALSCRVSRAQ